MEFLFPVPASHSAVQSLEEERVVTVKCIIFRLAAVYSTYSELSAESQVPRPGTLKKSPLFESHCEVSAMSSCHGNSPSPAAVLLASGLSTDFTCMLSSS